MSKIKTIPISFNSGPVVLHVAEIEITLDVKQRRTPKCETRSAASSKKLPPGTPLPPPLPPSPLPPLPPLPGTPSPVSQLEQQVKAIIQHGCYGVSASVFSSLLLREATLKVSRRIPPLGPAWSKVLTRIGYKKFPPLVKWRGHPHTIYIAADFPEETTVIRTALDRTVVE